MASKKLSAGSLAMFDEAMADGTADEMANDFFGSASTPVAQPAEEPDGSTPVQPEPRRLSENTMAMFDDMFSGAGDADVKRDPTAPPSTPMDASGPAVELGFPMDASDTSGAPAEPNPFDAPSTNGAPVPEATSGIGSQPFGSDPFGGAFDGGAF